MADAATNWWEGNLDVYKGDASGVGSQRSVTNPNTGIAESLIDQPGMGQIPWSEYQRLQSAGGLPKDISGNTARYKLMDEPGLKPKQNLMDQFGWALPFLGFAGAGMFGGANAAGGLEAASSGGLDMLLNPAQASFPGGYQSMFSPSFTSAPGSLGALEGAAGVAGASGAWNTLGEGSYGATGLEGAPEGGVGYDQLGTGIDQLMGTGGPMASGGSGPMQMLQYYASNPGAFLQNPLGSIAKAAGIPGNNAGGGGSSWSAPSALMSIASGLYGLSESEKQKKLAKMAMERSDPFASSRGQYVERLNTLMGDPSSITKVPGYDAGLQAVERRMAAQGFNGSGNMMTALSKYGGDFYNQEVQRLMQLSGAGAAPGAGSATGLQGYNSGVDTAGKALAELGYGGTRATGGITMPPAVTAWLKTLGV